MLSHSFVSGSPLKGTEPQLWKRLMAKMMRWVTVVELGQLTEGQLLQARPLDHKPIYRSQNLRASCLQVSRRALLTSALSNLMYEPEPFELRSVTRNKGHQVESPCLSHFLA